jgi:hypothetical protein
MLEDGSYRDASSGSVTLYHVHRGMLAVVPHDACGNFQGFFRNTSKETETKKNSIEFKSPETCALFPHLFLDYVYHGTLD